MVVAISLPRSEKVSKYPAVAADTVAWLSLLYRLRQQLENGTAARLCASFRTIKLDWLACEFIGSYRPAVLIDMWLTQRRLRWRGDGYRRKTDRLDAMGEQLL